MSYLRVVHAHPTTTTLEYLTDDHRRISIADATDELTHTDILRRAEQLWGAIAIGAWEHDGHGNVVIATKGSEQ